MNDTVLENGIGLETEIEPIMLDVDTSVEEYDLDIDSGEDFDMEVDSKIEHIITDGGNLPKGGEIGDIVMKRSLADYDAEWVTPASSAEKDNTRPITAAAVYTEIGNINALLATI